MFPSISCIVRLRNATNLVLDVGLEYVSSENYVVLEEIGEKPLKFAIILSDEKAKEHYWHQGRIDPSGKRACN